MPLIMRVKISCVRVPDKTEIVSLIEEVDKGEIRIFRAEEEMKALSLEIRPSRNL